MIEELEEQEQFINLNQRHLDKTIFQFDNDGEPEKIDFYLIC